MDAIGGFIKINQDRRGSKLSGQSVVFIRIKVLAGVGSVSEYSKMTIGAPWLFAYGDLFRAWRDWEYRANWSGSALSSSAWIGYSQAAFSGLWTVHCSG